MSDLDLSDLRRPRPRPPALAAPARGPVTGGTWTQQPGEVDHFVSMVARHPPECETTNASVNGALILDGESTQGSFSWGASARGFNEEDAGNGAVRFSDTVNLGLYLPAPASAEEHTIEVEVGRASCIKDGEQVPGRTITVESVEVYVIAAR